MNSTIVGCFCVGLPFKLGTDIVCDTGHSSSGSTMYAGMDMASGELVAVGEWTLKWRHFTKKASSVDKEEDTEGASHLKQVDSSLVTPNQR